MVVYDGRAEDEAEMTWEMRGVTRLIITAAHHRRHDDVDQDAAAAAERRASRVEISSHDSTAAPSVPSDTAATWGRRHGVDWGGQAHPTLTRRHSSCRLVQIRRGYAGKKSQSGTKLAASSH